MLKRCLKPDVYAELKAKAEQFEELFMEITVGRRADLPQVRHLLIHLDRRPNYADIIPGSIRGNFIIIFYVHKDALGEIQPMVDYLKRDFKRANDWNETTRYEIDKDKISDLPSFKL